MPEGEIVTERYERYEEGAKPGDAPIEVRDDPVDDLQQELNLAVDTLKALRGKRTWEAGDAELAIQALLTVFLPRV